MALDVDWWKRALRHLQFRANPRNGPITARKTLVHWRHLELKRGVDLERFIRSPMDAQDEAENHLIRVLENIENDVETVTKYNFDVKCFLRLADVAGFRDEMDLHLKEEPEGIPNAFSPDELQVVLAYHHPNGATDLRLRALIHFALTLGWRRSEIAALELRDLDQDGLMVHCRRPEKGGRKRWVPVSKELFSPRRPFGAYLKGRPIVEDDPGAVWTAIHSQHKIPVRCTSDGFGRDITRISNTLGFPFNFTRARHTAVTAMIEADRHPRFIQFYFGWRNLSQISRYGNVRAPYARSQIEELPSLWAGETPRSPKK